MFTATPRCGTVLGYEARSFRPDPGQVVPCRPHGYCVVVLAGGSRSGVVAGRRARPGTQDGLLHWLNGRPETTVRAMRRHGSTLRMVSGAERDGLIAVDLDAGRVLVREAVEGSPRCSAGVLDSSPPLADQSS